MGNNNYQIYFEVALKAAEKAGKLLLDNFIGKRNISYKGRINLVTEMDIRSEELIVSEIKEKFPTHDILAEERSNRSSNSNFCWLIDPLDGTTNYAHEFGFWAVSIALSVKNEIVLGVVYAPYLNECYTAIKGGGAELNKKIIKVSTTDKLEKSLVATGFPYDVKETHSNIDYFNRSLLRTQAVRRPGSAAIDLCSVAAGKFDGFWELGLYPWDTAAGCLITTEAGGKITTLNGGDWTHYEKEILATNGLIHREMMETLK